MYATAARIGSVEIRGCFNAGPSTALRMTTFYLYDTSYLSTDLTYIANG